MSVGTGKEMSATIIALTDQAEYRASIVHEPLMGTLFEKYTRAVRVSLPADALKPRYAFVASYAIDDNPVVACSPDPRSIPSETGDRFPSIQDAETSIEASQTSTVGAKACGGIYTESKVLTHPALDGHYRYVGTLSTDTVVFIDTTGVPVKAYTLHSSGNDRFDKAALDVATASTYAPAKLLCDPVVSEYLFRLKTQYSW